MPTTPPAAPRTPKDELEARATAESAAVREYSAAQRIGLALGPLVFAALVLAPPPADLEPAGWRTAAVGLWMAIWWITEAIPIPATALLPLVLFPVLGAGAIGEAASPYANPLIFLFLGGFIIALAIQRWGLHRRIALNIIRIMGVRPRAIVAGFMASSALLSMWVSNTATAMMMMPIALSVVHLARAARTEEENAAGYSNFSVALMLGTAYACSIGGMATLIGTPGNALLAGYMDETYGIRIGFGEWMLVGVPLLLAGLPLTHLLLTYVVFPVRLRELAGGRELIQRELAGLGPLSRAEASVAAVFATVALLWIAQPLLGGWVPGLSDAGIAVFGALLLFLIPAGRHGGFLLDWETAESLPWGVLLLFGGGLSLAAAVTRTGLAEWIGARLGAMGTLPVLGVVVLIATVIVLLTELTSNTATTAAFLPVVSALAIGLGENPLLLAIPAVLAASAAFMLPVATPPNAIVYGSSFVTIPQMARAGALLNLIFLLLITALTFTLAVWAFGIELGTLPAWAAAGKN